MELNLKSLRPFKVEIIPFKIVDARGRKINDPRIHWVGSVQVVPKSAKSGITIHGGRRRVGGCVNVHSRNQCCPAVAAKKSTVVFACLNGVLSRDWDIDGAQNHHAIVICSS